MHYIIDVTLLALIIFVVYRSVSKGFIASLFDSCAVGISAVATYFLCSPVSKYVYENFVEGLMKTRLSNALENGISSNLSLTDKVLKMVEALPAGAIRLAQTAGVDLKALAQGVTSSAADTNEKLINAVVDKVAVNIMMVVVEAVVAIVLFILIAIIVKAFAKTFGKKANDIPIIGGVNKALGGVFGIVKAILILFVVCTLMYIISGSSKDENVINSVNYSKIYSIISGMNPLISIIS